MTKPGLEPVRFEICMFPSLWVLSQQGLLGGGSLQGTLLAPFPTPVTSFPPPDTFQGTQANTAVGQSKPEKPEEVDVPKCKPAGP